MKTVLYIHGKGGEHLFHTEEEMKSLNEWIRSQK